MRMWMIEPSTLCRRHLSAEHMTLHAIVTRWERGHWGYIIGLVNRDYIDTHALYSRHEDLAAELARRGYKHTTPLYIPTDMIEMGEVDARRSRITLYERCPQCRHHILNSVLVAPGSRACLHYHGGTGSSRLSASVPESSSAPAHCQGKDRP